MTSLCLAWFPNCLLSWLDGLGVLDVFSRKKKKKPNKEQKVSFAVGYVRALWVRTFSTCCRPCCLLVPRHVTAGRWLVSDCCRFDFATHILFVTSGGACSHLRNFYQFPRTRSPCPYLGRAREGLNSSCFCCLNRAVVNLPVKVFVLGQVMVFALFVQREK